MEIMQYRNPQQLPVVTDSGFRRCRKQLATASHVVNHALRVADPQAAASVPRSSFAVLQSVVQLPAYTASPGFFSWLSLSRQKRVGNLVLFELTIQDRCCTAHHISWTRSEHVRQEYLDRGSDGTTPVTAYGCDWYGVDAAEPALTFVTSLTNSTLSHADLRTPLVSPSQSNSTALPAFESEAPGTPSSRDAESKGHHQGCLPVTMQCQLVTLSGVLSGDAALWRDLLGRARGNHNLAAQWMQQIGATVPLALQAARDIPGKPA